MNRLFSRVLSRISAHPSDEALSDLLSGELADRKAQGVHKHLQQCWQCRARYVQLDQATLKFVEYHNLIADSEDAHPSLGRKKLLSRMKQVEAAMPRSFWIGALRSLRFMFSGIAGSPLVSGSAVLVVVLAVLVFWFWKTPALSASEILERAQFSEKNDLARIQRPVVYQRLRIHTDGIP